MKILLNPNKRSSLLPALRAAIAGMALLAAAPAWSQTTLIGDHIIDGSLDVLGGSFGLGTFGTDPDQPGFSITAGAWEQYVEGYEDPFVNARIILQPTTGNLSGTEYHWRDHEGNDLLRLTSLAQGDPYDNGLHVNLPLRVHGGLYADGLVYANGSQVVTVGNFSAGFNSDIMLSGSGNTRTIGVTATPNGNGSPLTVQAGIGSGTNRMGGNLVLRSGGATGTGSSGIEFRTVPPGVSGAGGNSPTTRMTITGTGNVGIGTTSPSSRLHVVGETRIDGQLLGGNANVGTGLVGSLASQVIVGKYNDTNTNDNGVDHTQGLFIVGIGTGAGPTQRVNGLRVTTDGSVLIKKSGDIDMGLFVAGDRP